MSLGRCLQGREKGQGYPGSGWDGGGGWRIVQLGCCSECPAGTQPDTTALQ